MVELDHIDRRILQVLQRNNQLTTRQSAEKARISAPTCLRRVRRLRQEKVIAADVSILDPYKVGKSFFVFIEIVLERQSEQLQQAFEKKMQRTDEVMQCYMISGHSDFLIMAQFSNMDAYHEFVRRALTNDSNVRNFRSLFAINRSKFRTEINLKTA